MINSSKIFLYLFLVIFLVSNTGLPISIHLCQMMKKASLEECDMCKSHKDACCNDNYTLKLLKSGNDNCCDTKIAAEPLKDRFISVKENLIETAPLSSAVVEIIDSQLFNVESTSLFSNSVSPPGKENQVIFIINSTFLI